MPPLRRFSLLMHYVYTRALCLSERKISVGLVEFGLRTAHNLQVARTVRASVQAWSLSAITGRTSAGIVNPGM